MIESFYQQWSSMEMFSSLHDGPHRIDVLYVCSEMNGVGPEHVGRGT